MSKNYIIWTLSNITYPQSNGVRVLHILANLLRKKGYTVHKYIAYPNKKDTDFIKKITTEMQKNDIVIYPESVEGNPLQFKNIVRFVLYHPKFINNNLFHSSETIFTWDESFFPNVPILNFPTIDTNLFYTDKTPKIYDCSFVYKKGKFREVQELKNKNLIEITISYPPSREELANLLRATDTLYSYDDCTILIEEAKLCGVKVKIVTQNDIIDAPNNIIFTKEYVENILNYFVTTTQNLNYTGKIQSNLSIKIKLIYKIIQFIFLLNIKCIKKELATLKLYQ